MNESDERSQSFTRRATIAIALAIGLTALALTLWYAIYVILLAFAGILIAVLLLAMADGVHFVTRLPQRWSLALMFVLVIGIISLSAWLLTPRVAVQIEELRVTFPAAMEELGRYIEQYRWARIIREEIRDLGDVSDFQESLPNLAAGAASAVMMTGSAIVAIVVAAFIGLYMAINPEIYTDGALRLVPPAHRMRVLEIFTASANALRWWLIGRVIAMTVVGVLTAVGLWILGVPLSLSLGLLAGLLDFVPNIGPIVSLLPAVIIAFAEGPQTALYVVVLYFVVQQIESYIVTPIVQQETVSLPPAFTVFLQLLFTVLAGPLGLLLATPIAAAGLVIVRGFYVQDALGDRQVSLQE